MANPIVGKNEIIVSENGEAAKFFGQAAYQSRALMSSRQLGINNTSGLLPINDAGVPVPFTAVDNQYRAYGREKVVHGFLELQTYGTRAYMSDRNYILGKRAFELVEPANARSAINRTFDAQAIAGINEPTVYNTQGARTANSVWAKAKKGNADTVLGIRQAIDAINAEDGRPVVYVGSQNTLDLLALSQSPINGVLNAAYGDAVVFVVPSLLKKASLLKFNSTVTPYIVADANYFYTAAWDGFDVNLVRGGYDPVETFTGNTGSGEVSTPATSKGYSHSANGKVELDVVTFMDYGYFGDDSTAFTNLPATPKE